MLVIFLLFVRKETREVYGAIPPPRNRAVDCTWSLAALNQTRGRGLQHYAIRTGAEWEIKRELKESSKFKIIMTKTMNYGAAVATIAALLSLTAALPAFADYNDSEIDVDLDNDVKVTVVNSAFVVNSTTASASTGGNWAGGSYGGNGAEGGNGGYGGDADADADADADEYGDADADADADGGKGGAGGAGGNGGHGGLGGAIATGDAEANAGTMNQINTTDIKVEGCGCDADLDDVEGFDDVDYDADNEVKIDVVNEGALVNFTDAYAKTGWNWADGSFGGDGAEGGNGSTGGDADADADADAEDGDADADADADGGKAGTGGEGGNGGNVEAGGIIVTGNAVSNSGTVNLINSLLIRVIR